MSGVSVLAKRLRQARVRAGLSQRKLGIAAGLEESAANVRINQYERGRHTPNIQMVQRFAKVLRVPTPFFYAEDDGLALWILAFAKASMTLRQSVVKKMEKLP